MDQPLTRTLDLRDYTRAIRGSARMVVTVAVAFGLAAGAYVLIRPPVYRAHARVLVESIVDPTIVPSAGSTALAVKPDMNTETQIARSRGTAAGALERLAEETSAVDLLAPLVVQTVRDTELLEFLYEDPSPERAAAVVNAFADAYLDARRAEVKAKVDGVINPIDGELQRLREEYADARRAASTASSELDQALALADATSVAQQITVFAARRAELELLSFTSDGGRSVARATVPERQAGPSITFAALFGMLVGAVLGSGIAVTRKLVADRVTGQDELEEQMGAPVIGVIPAVHGWSERTIARLVTREDPASPAAEAYRTLGTNIRYIASRRPLQTILITSALPEEGKSATATNLAVVLAQSGLRTILVDADLRRPRAEHFLNVAHGPGLREALEGWRELVDVIQMSEVPGLAMLRSGDAPADPASLLSGPTVERVMAELRKAADFIVCDVPPVLPVADASILAAQMDGILFVHDPKISPRTALGEAVRQLRTAGGEIIGGVHNNVTKSQRTYLGYARYEAYYGTGTDREGRFDGTPDGGGGRTFTFPPPPARGDGSELERTRRRRRRS